MKAFYVVCNGYDAILIPQSSQAWISPSSKDLELFASDSPNFIDWQGCYEDTLEGVRPNVISVRRYWEAGSETIVVAESDEGVLTIFEQKEWNRKVEEEALTLPKSA